MDSQGTVSRGIRLRVDTVVDIRLSKGMVDILPSRVMEVDMVGRRLDSMVGVINSRDGHREVVGWERRVGRRWGWVGG